MEIDFDIFETDLRVKCAKLIVELQGKIVEYQTSSTLELLEQREMLARVDCFSSLFDLGKRRFFNNVKSTFQELVVEKGLSGIRQKVMLAFNHFFSDISKADQTWINQDPRTLKLHVWPDQDIETFLRLTHERFVSTSELIGIKLFASLASGTGYAYRLTPAADPFLELVQEGDFLQVVPLTEKRSPTMKTLENYLVTEMQLTGAQR